MFRKKNKAFTLTEMLIVVIILWLLAAIILPKITDSLWKTKEVASNANMVNLQKAMDVYYINNNSYPIPDNAKTLSWNNFEWYQWVIWSWVVNELWLKNEPVDPVTNQPYGYILSNTEYWIINVVEYNNSLSWQIQQIWSIWNIFDWNILIYGWGTKNLNNSNTVFNIFKWDRMYYNIAGPDITLYSLKNPY